jgi:hypothetical protein
MDNNKQLHIEFPFYSFLSSSLQKRHAPSAQTIAPVYAQKNKHTHNKTPAKKATFQAQKIEGRVASCFAPHACAH